MKEKKMEGGGPQKFAISRFLFVNEWMTHVIGYIDDMCSPETLIPGKGYVNNKHIWVYSSNKVSPGPKPIFYPDTNLGGFVFQPCVEPFSMDDWRECNLRENTHEEAENISKTQITCTPEMIEAMNNATSNYRPVIESNDDFLKKIIKTAINLKESDLNMFKPLLSKTYALSNLKSALKGKTKMSPIGFLTWLELLGLSVTVIVEDSGLDKRNPLKSTIFYRTDTDKITDNDGKEFELYESETEDE